MYWIKNRGLHCIRQSIPGSIFIDTADVYGDGRSERLVGRLKKERKEEIIVATKAGRRLPKQTVEGYSEENLTGWVEDSLRNLSTDALDLLQLHCPPTALYDQPETFAILDGLVRAGKIRHYGVSIEKMDEAVKAIQYPNVQSVQIIFNCFRQRPSEVFFTQAKQKRVSIFARVPLASGLLTGKLNQESTFAKDDHRNFNRHGEAFDVGETFWSRLQRWPGSGRRVAQGAARGSVDEPVCAPVDPDV